MSPEVQAALAYGECRGSSSDYDLLSRIEGSNTPAQAAAEILAAEVRRLSDLNAKMADEMTRYLPVIERAENDCAIWLELTKETGIATANGYRAAISAAMKGTT